MLDEPLKRGWPRTRHRDLATDQAEHGYRYGWEP
jgi:hypothetical protein